MVTGGCGFIGSHTCTNLIKNNCDILIIDSLINSYEDIFPKIKTIFDSNKSYSKGKISFLKGDLRDTQWLDNVFYDHHKMKKPITSVIHFAGLKSINNSIKSPILYWDMNLTSTISLLSSMKKYDCRILIFSSSATVYKTNGNKLLKEEDVLAPNNTYGKTKLTIEEILKDLFNSDKNWRIANLRYFNPVGSDSSGLLEENPKLCSSNLFPSIMKVLNGSKSKLQIFGNDWPTHDGTCIRDYIHVMDLADAHVSTLDYLMKNDPQNIIINIGTGIGTSVLDVINTFQNFNNVNLPYEFVERRVGDQPLLVADNSLALKLLDWFPKRNIDDMCTDYVINL